MGSQDCPRNPEAILIEAIEAGITAFQFREKGSNALTGKEKIALGKRLRAICRRHKVPFFINNDAELIEELEVDGIHVGQGDMSPSLLREKNPNLQIGLSISNKVELLNSSLEDIDYIGAGAIFKTQSKSDAEQAVGLVWIQTLRELAPGIPIVGIGGINTENAHQVIDAGADGVAVISVITKSDDIVETVAAL